jgi:glycosyltransferase involved in cell wall biosynthesis
LHGHTVGGTNPALVEAMNLGLLIMTYDVEYNRETTENKALYFKDDKSLLDILIDFEEGRIDVEKYKNEMLQVADRRYKWEIITEKYSKVFRSCKPLKQR